MACRGSGPRQSTLGVPTLRGVATKRVYTYPQVAARIEEELGVRPSLSALRAAAAEERRRGAKGGVPRVTLGLPSPEPRPSATAPVLFSQAAIEAWLKKHPRRGYAAAVETLQRAGYGPRPEREGEARRVRRENVIRRARAIGVSWSDIAHALSAGSAAPISRAGAYQRFRHLDSQ